MAYYDKFQGGERRFSGARSQHDDDQPRRYGERNIPEGGRRFEDGPKREYRPAPIPTRPGMAKPSVIPAKPAMKATPVPVAKPAVKVVAVPVPVKTAPRVAPAPRPVPPAVHDADLPARRFERSDDRFEPHHSFEPEAMPENLLVGRNPIREAIKAGRDIEKLLVAKGDLSGSAREIVAKAREARIIVQEVDKSRLDAIYPNHQGMLAYVSAASYSTMEDIFRVAAERHEEPFVIILDGITDPHNLGAIIRTAECTGAHGVIVPERRSVGLTPAAVKAAAGATEYVKVVRVINLSRTIEELKHRGLWIVGAAMQGENAFRADLRGPMALVIGAEGEGISQLVLKNCDRVLSLPMTGHIDSLNASVAAGVLMYAVMNARRR